MLELKFIRENPEFVTAEIKKLNTEAPILEILDLDKGWRERLKEADSLKNLRNLRSKEIGEEKDQIKRQLLISQMQGINQKIKDLDKALKEIEEKLNSLLLLVPNLPHPSTPIGKDETENVIVKEHGEKKKFDFTPLSHWELGENLRIIDFEKGVKISGTRFYVLRGMGAALQRALISWMLDLHIKEHNYLEIYPPAMVKKECLFGTGQLPKFEENLYFDSESDLWFIPTAEVPLTNLHREEVLP
ncbi:MAG: serine--tRNA ligase, partial [Armatimonadetes bacterium]|nr:serine--tRNA ligase [Armatimonadota bacterium]